MATELAVISGKGGTGKTSVAASLAVLADSVVLADCDVDAADLHLVMKPTIIHQETFSGGSRATISPAKCTACGKCEQVCRFDAISHDGPANANVDKTFIVDPTACEGCAVCVYFCPENAIDFSPFDNGEWFISDTRCGPMVHAKLGVAEENSGKLVDLVRRQAKDIVKQKHLDWIIIDGSPGIGCPVIASITGADMVLIVTEPTQSGLHDLRRVANLTNHFGIRTMACINKWDLNKSMTTEIEKQGRLLNAPVAGRVRYDRAVTDAQIQGKSVVEFTDNGPAEDIRSLWKEIEADAHRRDNPTSERNNT